jgi:hypothetical protein
MLDEIQNETKEMLFGGKGVIQRLYCDMLTSSINPHFKDFSEIADLI